MRTSVPAKRLLLLYRSGESQRLSRSTVDLLTAHAEPQKRVNPMRPVDRPGRQTVSQTSCPFSSTVLVPYRTSYTGTGQRDVKNWNRLHGGLANKAKRETRACNLRPCRSQHPLAMFDASTAGSCASSSALQHRRSIQGLAPHVSESRALTRQEDASKSRASESASVRCTVRQHAGSPGRKAELIPASGLDLR